MKATICDRCGAIITQKNSGKTILIENPGNKTQEYTYDLCVSCAFQLRKWLEPERKDR